MTVSDRGEVVDRTVEGCSGTIPPAFTNTGMRSRGSAMVAVVGPLKLAPVKKSIHRPGAFLDFVACPRTQPVEQGR